MIQSMTGFGKHVIQLPSKKISVELKSLNSKSLDLNARMPSSYREKELELRKTIAGALKRGKVDFSLYIEFTGDETSAEVNEAAVKNYMNQLRSIADGDDIQLMEMALRMPDSLKTEREDIEPGEYEAIQRAVQEALKEIADFRSDEGSILEKDFLLRIQNLQILLGQVEQMDPDRQIEVRKRLEKAVADIQADLDENRFEQELVYYLEKYDITEEKVRLDNHLNYFATSLNSKESNGKKLGFIAQEIGREINTIGSKANYAPMQQLVVQMKDELEKIKEQMLNVL
ncbi:YicC/YloC family endoribonuclease [Pricia sp. S334]|uniref:YicC/YloC family endoribonuclease n=1 Tax=Pricia mediterranea TaxID=3076079 RepID=A0ABU3L5T6_9FLAO|nr:YicC/YloC family endoribonuclease [Pricia sp. S334]MDT7829106.1 YicC/YloC family endoribonuclease [Pricia sp. S334]